MTEHDNWKQLDGLWKTIQSEVFRLQKRIYKASRDGNTAEVRKLQRLLLKSYYARVLAVRKVSTDNQGKKTAGVDGLKSLTEKQRMKLVHSLKDLRNYRARPVKRKDIPKADGTVRHLGIPTMRDRAIQTLLLFALEPEWEAVFEPNSYGFRKGRKTMDAIKALWSSHQHSHKWIIDADISKCFDNISHEYLLDKLKLPPSTRRLVKSMLKAGVEIRFPDGHKEYQETDRGTPQGGAISPLLANIALHGLEIYLTEGLNKTNIQFIPEIYPQCPVKLIKAQVSNDPVYPQCPVQYVPKMAHKKTGCVPRMASRWNPETGTTKLREGALPYTHKGRASIYDGKVPNITFRPDNRCEYNPETGTTLKQQGAIPSNISCQKLLEKHWNTKLVRYADDFVAIYDTKEEAEQALTYICEILAEIGLDINQRKTKIVNSADGFDFLGFNIRTYGTVKNSRGIKCIVEPSKANIKRHYKSLKEAIIRQNKTKKKRANSSGHHLSAAQLIKILNPKIRGWCNYYRHVNARKAFEKLNYHLIYRLYKWAYKKYPKTYKKAITKFCRDFLYENRETPRFHDPALPHMVLKHHFEYKIDLDYVKVGRFASVFDGNDLYWIRRNYSKLDPRTGNVKRKLYWEQEGRCNHCGAYFTEGDLLEVHHIDQNRQNNRLKNLELIHRHCHDEKHRGQDYASNAVKG